jgi:hypothetical protein
MILEALKYLFDRGVELADAKAPIVEKTVEGRHYTSKELADDHSCRTCRRIQASKEDHEAPASAVREVVA